MQKSTMLTKEAALAQRKWYLVDATDLVLGRLSVKLADFLRGKNKPTYTPNVDGGDYIIVINASKVRLTGNKLHTEKWYRHSQYIGGLKERRADEMIAKYPVELIEEAVRGMLPKNRLSRRMITKMFVYPGAQHPHAAQNPTTLDWKESK